MIRLVKEGWYKNEAKLEEKIKNMSWEGIVDYKTLVILSVDTILNDPELSDYNWDTENITEIDNGAYQGTLLYIIPRDTYQPSEYDYLMTCVGYGSCSGCDSLEAIRNYEGGPVTQSEALQLKGLCRDILTSLIKPYNYGWRNIEMFNHEVI